MSRDVLSGHALDVAPLLLDAVVESRIGGARVRVRITETEAYGGVGEDPGSHSFRGPTPRTEVMFGRAGTLYVYFTYGMHWCVNVVTGATGVSSAVLLRAGEVIEGVEIARTRRPAARVDRDLARGPARLAAALGIDGAINGTDLYARSSLVRLTLSSVLPQYATSPRTGVAGEGASLPWRFHLPDDPTVSTYRPAQPRRRPSER